MKFFKNIILPFSFIILMIVFQFYVIGANSIFGVKPNIFLVIIIICNLWYDSKMTVMISTITGILLDIIYGNNFGVFTLSYTVVATVVFAINSGYKKQGRGSSIYVTFLGTSIFEIFQYIIYIVSFNNKFDLLNIITRVIMTSLLNIAIMAILYKPLIKIHENITEKNKIY